MADKILIVDDDLDTLRLVGFMLEKQGYKILAAKDGSQGIRVAAAEQPDLILLDVMMPGMDGFEVVRHLRSSEKTMNIPVLMLTAKTQVDDKVTGFEAGADDYLTKPIHPTELLSRVRTALSRVTQTAEAEAPEPVVAKPRGTTIGLIAAKGGLGVTTIALNLGISIKNKSNRETIIAEFRPGQGNIGLTLGYEHPEGINQLLPRAPQDIHPEDVEGELITFAPGIRFLLSTFNPMNAKYIDALEQIDVIVRHLTQMARVIIIDLGPSMTPFVRTVLPHCDNLIVIFEPFLTTLQQTKFLLDGLKGLGFTKERIDLISLNRVRTGTQPTIEKLSRILDHKIAVYIPPAPELAMQAATRKTPIILQDPESITSQQISKLAGVIIEKDTRPDE